MKFTETPLKGCFIIEPDIVEDRRGWFVRTFCKTEFEQVGHSKEWLQLNHSLTYKQGSIRGMHYQVFPFSEIKLVRCIAGKIVDVVVDVRRNSSTFLQWFGVELSAENKKMIYIPEGFAHGFQTLTNNCELIYHHTAMYTPGFEGGLMYDDKMINIQWKIPVTEISDRDRQHKYLDENFKGIEL